MLRSLQQNKFIFRVVDAGLVPICSILFVLKLNSFELVDPIIYFVAILSLISFGIISAFLPPYSLYIQFLKFNNSIWFIFRDISIMLITIALILIILDVGTSEPSFYIVLMLLLSSLFINLDYILSVMDKLLSDFYSYFIIARLSVFFICILYLFYATNVYDLAKLILFFTGILPLMRIISISFDSSQHRFLLSNIRKNLFSKFETLLQKRTTTYDRKTLVLFNFIGVIIANFDIFIFGSDLLAENAKSIDFAIALRVISSLTIIFCGELLISFFHTGKIESGFKFFIGMLFIAISFTLIFIWASFHNSPPSYMYIFSYALSIASLPLWSQMIQLEKISLLIKLQMIFLLIIICVFLNVIELGLARMIGFMIYFLVGVATLYKNSNFTSKNYRFQER